jgi:Winged helix-turn-helix DNA-binding
MSAERVAVRQVREITRLKVSGHVPTREIARRLGIAASTVRETLRRFENAGLHWPLPDNMTDGKLETALYTNRGTKQGHRRHAEPDWPVVDRELKRKHVTLLIVWDEYIAGNPRGYQGSANSIAPSNPGIFTRRSPCHSSFYAKHVPFVEGTGRILIGAGRIKQIGKLTKYERANRR